MRIKKIIKSALLVALAIIITLKKKVPDFLNI